VSDLNVLMASIVLTGGHFSKLGHSSEIEGCRS
jgi:hypothetical protein